MIFSASLLVLLTTATVASHHVILNVFDDEPVKQAKIIELLTGLGTEDTDGHAPKPFTFDQPNLYTNEAALHNFSEYYQEGFLQKGGAFSIFDSKISRDTSSLADLLYFAKDFDIFYEIASWAKSEIHPVQYLYGLVRAILHREDTSDMALPPMYEVLPNYFVPSTVINAAYRAKLNGINKRKFQVNNTGWEPGRGFSFSSMDSNMDREIILSYYREDVSRSDFFFKYFNKMDTRMSDGIKYGKRIERIEEWHYTAYKWILTRYNLERYAVGLPPVQPVFGKINSGYDPQLIDLYGHYLSSRPDNVFLQGTDLNNLYSMDKIMTYFRNSIAVNSDYKDMEAKFDGNLQHKFIEDDYYSKLLYKMLEVVDSAASSSNNKYSQGVLRNDMTRMRDPVYYQILAHIDHIVRSMENDNDPYLKEELAFPGVKINDVILSSLETFFEYYDFDISNAIPGKEGKYIASKLRLNHKPFLITLKINSNFETNGIIKIFLGIPNESLDKVRQSFTLIDTFDVKLNKGDNVITRNTGFNKQTSTPLKIEDILDGDHILDNLYQNQCSYPRHLLLPVGSTGGTPFELFAIVYPSNNSDKLPETTRTCGREHLTRDKTRSLSFPVDKPWQSSVIKLPNLKFVTPLIYHLRNTNTDTSDNDKK